MRSPALLVTIAAVAITARIATAHAAPTAPCARCTLDVPASATGPMPLLVVLHGDRERATAARDRWRAAAKDRGWALLSLQCPTDLGCTDSWWKWDGEPAWIEAQVAAVAAQVDIDPARVYLAGWSGGSTYLGKHATAWTDTFAAVVIHGGGSPPDTYGCPSRALPAYFLVGDKNPLHYLMKDLRTWFADCDQELTWDLVKGGAHEDESRALTRAKGVAILDWLAARARE
ncbi:MAG: PHB depolymerase family esterase [Deltaproteobacteria bacterium]|nr:PHB depolymerase family esterase [Deltaproteobacteria bacterium]